MIWSIFGNYISYNDKYTDFTTKEYTMVLAD